MFALETESSVKLLAFGVPSHGQSVVCRTTGEAKDRVARKETIRMERYDMILSF